MATVQSCADAQRTAAADLTAELTTLRTKVAAYLAAVKTARLFGVPRETSLVDIVRAEDAAYRTGAGAPASVAVLELRVALPADVDLNS